MTLDGRANETEWGGRSQRYLNHLLLVADQPGMLRACDVQRLFDEIPPSFDLHDFRCWLLEQSIPPRAAQRLRDLEIF